jgi:hypothetical protein
MILLRWIFGLALAGAALLFVRHDTVLIDSLRHALFRPAIVDRPLHPDPPWRNEPDPELAKKIELRMPGYKLEALYQCDRKTCGFRGRLAVVSFLNDGMIVFKSLQSNAAALSKLLNEPDPSIPSQADYKVTALGSIYLKNGNFIIAQLDEDNYDRASTIVGHALVPWRQRSAD